MNFLSLEKGMVRLLNVPLVRRLLKGIVREANEELEDECRQAKEQLKATQDELSAMQKALEASEKDVQQLESERQTLQECAEYHQTDFRSAVRRDRMDVYVLGKASSMLLSGWMSGHGNSFLHTYVRLAADSLGGHCKKSLEVTTKNARSNEYIDIDRLWIRPMVGRCNSRNRLCFVSQGIER